MMPERGFLRVANFEEYQHYKDRTPPWVKFYTKTLESYDFGTLPDATKWHACSLLLLAARLNNKIPNDPEWVQKKTQSKTRPNLQILIDIGFLAQDASNMLDHSREEKRREEVPAGFLPIAEYLDQSPCLNRPELRDWAWWESLANLYADTDLDVILHLKEVDVYLLSHPRKWANRKNWKASIAAWFRREVRGRNGAHQSRSKTNEDVSLPSNPTQGRGRGNGSHGTSRSGRSGEGHADYDSNPLFENDRDGCGGDPGLHPRGPIER